MSIDSQLTEKLTEQAEGIYKKSKEAKKPDRMSEGFIRDLFSNASSEDLQPYSAQDLVNLGKESWLHIQSRKPEQFDITIKDIEVVGSSSKFARKITVVEMLNDDQPFLLASLLAQFTALNLEVRFVIHPVFTLKRDGKGKLTEYFGVEPPSIGSWLRESMIQFHLDHILDAELRKRLIEELKTTLHHIRAAVVDWKSMMARMQATLSKYESHPPELPMDEVSEAVSFMQWLLDNNFTFLGLREYQATKTGDGYDLKALQDTALGIMRDPDLRILRRGKEFVNVSPEFLEFLRQPIPLIVTKASVRSRVHRHVHLDCIGIKLFDLKGGLVGELRIVGLFTASAYTGSIRRIPYLRRKVDLIIRRIGYDPNSHSGKALINVLEHYPRDELFQTDVITLTNHTVAMLRLKERPRVRVLVRLDKFDRFVSIFVFVPRDRFNTQKRIEIGNFLASVFNGRLSAVYPDYPEGNLARIHFIIGRDEGETPKPDQDTLEAGVNRIVRTWYDALNETVHDNFDLERAQKLIRKYSDAFSPAFQDTYPASTLIPDIKICESLSEQRPLIVSFYWRGIYGEDVTALKFFHLGSPIDLSARVPLLENMGFKVVNERSHCIEPKDGDSQKEIWLHDMVLSSHVSTEEPVENVKQRIEDAVLAVWNGLAEDDGYNALIISTGLDWYSVSVIRAISRYLRQIRIPFSEDYMWRTMCRFPQIAETICNLFYNRFDPRHDNNRTELAINEGKLLRTFDSAMDAVSNLDEDRILRAFVTVIQAMVRTNVFQIEDKNKSTNTISFKISSRKLENLPKPRPLYEIFVYGTRFEGIHLRFGKVARGGLRWSDRPQDFRTEVLGLVKAQQVKNAVIVPVGSKGGFVPKHLPTKGTRDAIMEEGIACYRGFVGALLDITDNYSKDGKVNPPRNVTRLDEDDPYLVVAADKGTATFSDIANGISQDHRFWLDDAFASGGSVGYDHKKMGITARGGWEAVKRHFREMNYDIQTQPFTAIGVGDMSGDVFGNGMLLSQQTKLIAAFDHRDIFIDPDPDPATSHAERKRIFELPRSSWQDYNKSLISKGGGVFSRSEKSIVLSEEIRKLLDIEVPKLTPMDLIKAILQARADLLWFGGIGTYVRSSHESDEAAGDRANDGVRITGSQLRVKVVGEGANLGITQLGRVEFAENGGRINTDAIDNSAGVNSSDLEVNVKIALGLVVADGRLDTEGRNKLLAKMTDNVANLVLRNNYQQTLAISLADRRAKEGFDNMVRHMRTLEREGHLERAVEFLPDDGAIADRAAKGQGFTRPEISVLLSYAKNVLYEHILQSALPDDPFLEHELFRYFPTKLAELYPDALKSHRLRREIISTNLTNSIINRGGPAYITLMRDETGASEMDIAKAFVVARDSFSLVDLNGAINELDNKVDSGVQLSAYEEVRNSMISISLWYLMSNLASKPLAEVIDALKKGVQSVAGTLEKQLQPAGLEAFNQSRAKYIQDGMPDGLAHRLASLPFLIDVPDMVLVSQSENLKLPMVSAAFFNVSEHFRIQSILSLAENVRLQDYYDRIALSRARRILSVAQREIARNALSMDQKGDSFAAWLAVHHAKAERTKLAIADILASSPLTLSKFSVASSMLNDLVV